MNFSALCMGETVNCWLEIKFYWKCTMLRAARENLYCIIEKHPRKFCLLMTTMIGINRKFFRETIWLVDASAIWRQSNWGMTQKSSGKMCCEDHVLRWSSSCANFFAASTLMRSRFFQTAKVFMATSQLVLPMLIMDSKASRSFIRFYSWLVFLRVGPFLFQEFYICTYIELYNIEQSYWVTIATSWHLGVKWAHTRRNHF